MAARTTDAEIRAILDVDATITNLDPFIAIANQIINQNLATLSIYVTSPSLLDIVETWLAAHFVCIRDPRVDTERLGV